jgi:hypothetical protein
MMLLSDALISSQDRWGIAPPLSWASLGHRGHWVGTTVCHEMPTNSLYSIRLVGSLGTLGTVFELLPPSPLSPPSFSLSFYILFFSSKKRKTSAQSAHLPSTPYSIRGVTGHCMTYSSAHLMPKMPSEREVTHV